MEIDGYSPYLCLYAAMIKPQITNLVKNFCVDEEVKNLEKIQQDWENATNELRKLETVESGIVDYATTKPITTNEKIEKIRNDPLFKNSFSNTPIDFAWVEIDDLIAVQREVSLTYMEQLSDRIGTATSENDLIDLCLSPKQTVPIPKATQTQTGWIFSSPSVDFRFLGGYLKDDITEDDLKMTSVGAFPVRAITLFVGYGSGSVNVLQAGQRLILNNGFHRVCTLYKKGIRKIPVVVQKIGNPALEFPPQISGLTKEYLLGHQRPILIKDFFNEKLTKTLKRKNMMRTVRVNFGIDVTDLEV